MSCYYTKIVCPKCKTLEQFFCEDDKYGWHVYGYKCEKCEQWFRDADFLEDPTDDDEAA